MGKKQRFPEISRNGTEGAGKAAGTGPVRQIALAFARRELYRVVLRKKIHRGERMLHMIFTVEGEYGSGAGILGRGLAEALALPCYDQAALEQAAMEEASLCAAGAYRAAAGAYGEPSARMAAAQREAVEVLAREAGSCVFLGDSAGAILEPLGPVRLFVYGDRRSKLERCRCLGEGRTDAELECRMRQRDRARARQYELFSELHWGMKEAYHLCVNTSGWEPEALIPPLAAYCRLFLDR